MTSITDPVAVKLMAEESARWERIRLGVRALAKDIALVWHQGDGLGGSLVECLACEVRAAGYFVESPVEFYARTEQDRPSSHRKGHRVAAALRRQVFERDKYRCLGCDTHLDLSIDHVIPIARGGTTEFDNLQTLCRSCNSRKGTDVTEGGVR